jgi:hypothetical protein
MTARGASRRATTGTPPWSSSTTSGGGWGPDGKLYLSGHDRPELYVLQLPTGGGVLDHLDTLGMEAEGQAIDWDESQPGVLYGITRRSQEILAMRVPLSR